jgi:hypothetical protein
LGTGRRSTCDQPALDAPQDRRGNALGALGLLLDLLPGELEVGLLLRNHREAFPVLHRVKIDLDLLPLGDGLGVAELLERQDTLGLEPEVDEHRVRQFLDDPAVDDLPDLQAREGILVQVRHRLPSGGVFGLLRHLFGPPYRDF